MNKKVQIRDHTLYQIWREIMNNMILDFLEAYKSLDELCKQILSSDKGISKYIDEMNYERQGHMIVTCWEKDYKQLKKMRWIRNQLVHETNSFQDKLVDVEDIEWLKNFRTRILECTDPFSLLYQSRSVKRKTTKQDEYPPNYFKTYKPSCNTNLVFGVKIFIGIIILVIIILLINFNI